MHVGLVHQGNILGQVKLDEGPNFAFHLQVTSDFGGWEHLCEFFGILPSHDDFGPFRFERLVNNFFGEIIRHGTFVVGLGSVLAFPASPLFRRLAFLSAGVSPSGMTCIGGSRGPAATSASRKWIPECNAWARRRLQLTACPQRRRCAKGSPKKDAASTGYSADEPQAPKLDC